MSSVIQKLNWRVQVLAYDALSLLARLFSFDQVSAFGGWLLRLIGPRTAKNEIVQTGLRTAFPDASDAQLKAWTKAQWDNTGRTFAEFIMLSRVKIFDDRSRVSVQGLDHLRRAYNTGKGFVIVTGHFANWEIMAAVFAQAGLPVNITYRHINNPYLDERVRKQREKYGVKLLVAKSGARGAKELLEALKRGHGIALMNDQKFNEGLSVPFFGVSAMTAPGPTRLALKAGAPLIPVYISRDKAKFHVHIHSPLDFEKTGNRDADTLSGVTAITQFIEARVTEQPEGWFWVHRRWDKSHYRT